MNPQHFQAHAGHGCTGGAVGTPIHPPQVQEGFHQLTVQPMLEAWMDTVKRDMVQRQDQMMQMMRLEMMQARPTMTRGLYGLLPSY